MPVPGSLAMVWWQQETDALSGHDVHLLMIFLGVIAAALVVQAVGVVIAGIFSAKLLTRVDALVDGIDQKTTPLLLKTNELVHDLAPKIRTISQNLEQTSYTVRVKVDEIGQTVSQINRTVQETNDRVLIKMAEVDAIVSEALVASEEISRSVQHGIRVPIRQVAGIVAGLKAGVETLVAKSPFVKPKAGRPLDL